MKFRKPIISVVIGVALMVISASSNAQSISVSYVTVGNPGNAPDPATGSMYGEVDYSYNIGKYDVTDSQYAVFLNDVDPTGDNALALYSPQGDAEYGITFNSGAANGSKYSVISGYANMPVVDVDYWDTLRFANYLDDGNTESGAYTLIGGNTDGSGTPSNASSLLANPQHNAGAAVWLPSENEWYKAAYYSPNYGGPGVGGYYAYATQSNTAPGNVIGSGTDEANYYTGNGYSVTQNSSPYYDNPSQNYLTATGTFSGSASYYGTYDQSGDVYNWEATTASSQYSVVGGGYWANPDPFSVSSSNVELYSPTNEDFSAGFRVASVPEPRSMMLMLAGVAGLVFARGKSRKV